MLRDGFILDSHTLLPNPLESVVVFLDGSVVANPLVVVESVLVP